MFYRLKKAIMTRAVAKRNLENPFDYAKAESFTLEGAKDPFLNNSYYFSAHNDRMSVFARLGRRVNMDESWFCVYLDGKLYSLKEEFFSSGESPLSVKKEGENWTVSFQGVLNGKDEAGFSATFVATQAPVDFTCDMPAERMAAGIANEKWNRKFFADLQNVSGQCHYEQEGFLEGNLTLNGESLSFMMNEFIDAVLHPDSGYHKRLMSIIPDQFKTEKTDLYSKIQVVLDYISNMTDLYAVQLYKDLRGIE